MNEQIRQLLDRFLQKEELSEKELRSLKDWIDEASNASSLKIWMQEVWNSTNEVETSLHFEVLVREINQEFQTQRAGERSPAKRFMVTFQRVAAILILPLLIVLGYQFFLSPKPVQQLTEVIVPKGQKTELILPDSTHIWLNSGSKLRYSSNFLSESGRQVFLEGEAYFEVTHYARSPFTVHIERSSIEVLGTKFNVKAYAADRQIEASLFHGKINFVANEGRPNRMNEQMSPGDKVRFNLETNQINKVKFGNENLAAWKNNRLVFTDDNFDAVVRKIERWYNVQISYKPEQFVGQRLTLALEEGESIEQLLQIMQKIMNIHYEIKNRQINIEPNGVGKENG